MTPEAFGALAACAQCGLPVVERPSDPEAVAQFCCSGCRVAWTIAGRGDGGATDRVLARLVLSAFLSMGVMVCSLSLYGEAWGERVGADVSGPAAEAMRGLARMAALALTIPIVWLLGVPLARAVVEGKRWFSSDALVVAGVGAAFGVSSWNAFTNRGEVYFETTAMVLVLVGLGRWIEVRAKGDARKRLGDLAPARVARATRIQGAGDRAEGEEEVDASQLAVGDRVLVRPGSVVPADGVVRDGSAFVDTAFLTGESVPRAVQVGERVFAGSVSTDGALELEVTEVGDERLCARVEALMQDALASRSRAGRLADRLAGVLLPVVFALAVGTIAFQMPRLGVEGALLAGLSVVLISCPCALGIATPMAFWFALSSIWKRGVLVRGADPLERIAGAQRVLFDKTGTLVDDVLHLVDVEVPEDSDLASGSGRAVQLAAALESRSEHPIGRALREAAAAERGDEPERFTLHDVRPLPGVGIEGRWGERFLRLVRDPQARPDDAATRVALQDVDPDGTLRTLAVFRLEGRARSEAKAVVAELRSLGLEARVLTGDAPGPAGALARELGLEVEDSLSPADKLARIEAAGPGTLYVGDGLNDVAAIAAADVGLAVHRSVERTSESADVNLPPDGLAQLPELVRTARRSLRAARLNLAWAFGYNALGLGLAASGQLSPVFAASAMVVSSAFVVVQSARLRQPA